MLYPGWIKGQTANSVVGLEAVADQVTAPSKQMIGGCAKLSSKHGARVDAGAGSGRKSTTGETETE